MQQVKILLDESDIPENWYNVVADMPNPPAPPLGPDSKPIGPEALAAIFPGAIIEQEVSRERWIPIPEPVREIYRQWRPSPMYRALRLEQALGTPARIYYKYEGVSPAGSHKPNTSVPQAYYNHVAGVHRLATETGAGQWGSALALAGRMFGIEVRVYMVRVSYEQKPFRRSMMETWGAEVIASPSTNTNSGRNVLAHDADSPGSLGIAISEAVEEAAGRKDTNYALGSVLNHVLLHQTVIGLEAQKQFEKAGDYPDVVIACCGGGSNFGGTAFPFFRRQGRRAQSAAGRGRTRVVPHADPRPLCVRFGRHRGPDAADADVHAGAQLRSAVEFTPAGCATTAIRRWSRSFIMKGWSKRSRCRSARLSRPGSYSRAPRALFPAPETNHAIRVAIDEASPASGPASRGLFSSPFPAMATSTWRLTTVT